MAATQLPQQWTLITGAGSGIGRALAKTLAAEGQGVILMGRRRGALKGTEDRILSRYPQASCLIMATDIADARALNGAVLRIQEFLINKARALTGLVHCAGIGAPQDAILESSPQALEEALAVNVMAPLKLTRQLLPLLRQTPQGRVLFVGAGMDEKVQPGTGPYGISKMALKRLFRQMLADQQHHPYPNDPALIFYQPGMVDTPGLRQHTELAAQRSLPHAAYLEQALKEGSAMTAEEAARRMMRLLVEKNREAVSGREWHARDLSIPETRP